ncbi:MAG: peptidase M64 N-terminal domain-containing protein, partial [Ignavibacteriales bacterium]
MKKISVIPILVLLLANTVASQDMEMFNKFFADKTMRIDYYHIGDASDEFITLDQIYKYGIWAGSRVHLIDEMNLGRYCVKIYDAASGQVIYSKGF